MMQKTICTKELLNNNVEDLKLHPIYSDIWNTLNKVLVDECIEKCMVNLPKFGQIKIERRKRKAIVKDGKIVLPIDWPKTRAGWRNGTLKKDKFIYYNRNWYLKLKWSKPRVQNISAYSFKPSRTNGKECNSGFYNKVAAFLKESELNYLKIPLIN